jgi:tetratricopeptide (TPR) repeat protein
MKRNIDALKKAFREGRRAEAIAACEAICRADPGDREVKRLCATMHAVVQDYPRALELLHELREAGHGDADVLFNIAMCERESRHFDAAQTWFRRYTETYPDDSSGWASLGECLFQLQRYADGLRASERAIALDDASLPAWANRGNCQKGLGQFDAALASYQRANQIQPTAECWFDAGRIHLETDRPADALDCLSQAIRLAPDAAPPRSARGDAYQRLGRMQDAVADYRKALELAPGDDETLKKASLCLLQAGQGAQALDLCRAVLRAAPDSLTARLGAEWVLSQLVPIWHVPMMNERERNQAYADGLRSVVTPDTRVFEIGTGSGLLAMMAARLGARQVVTCEAVPLIAQTATRIIERNGYADRVSVIARPSQAVRLGADLPERADLLVHEIFSSELLGEHVLPAIEDAKARLLAPGGEILPSAASIMVALVGGEALGRYLHMGEAFGFDLREFNAIQPKKVPLYREDLAPVMLSDDVEAFRFDFRNASTFPAERRTLALRVGTGGTCHGVIQWIRVELGAGITFENHPARHRPVANWQCTVYAFAEPVRLDAGAVVSVAAMHDRSRPWFDLLGVSGA